MQEPVMDPKLVDYYMIDCAIQSTIGNKYCYHIKFGNPRNILGGSL